MLPLMIPIALLTAWFMAKKTYDRVNEKDTLLAIATAVLVFLATFAATIAGPLLLFVPLLFHR